MRKDETEVTLSRCLKSQITLIKENWALPLSVGLARQGHRGFLKTELIKNCRPRRCFFQNRAAKLWNKLPNNALEAPTVNSFKNRIDNIKAWAATEFDGTLG